MNFKFQRKKIFFQDFVFEFQIIQVEFSEIVQIYLDSMVLKYIILYLKKKYNKYWIIKQIEYNNLLTFLGY